MDSLPVAECLPELAVAPPSVEPAQSFTVAANNPPSAPAAEVPTATPAPTQTPVPTPTAVANRKPTLSSLTVSTRKISYDTDDYCPNAETRVTFRVKAGDDDGVTGVTLFWREPGAGSFARAAMSRTRGLARASGTWQVTLDTTANGITKAGKLAYYAVATDADGRDAAHPDRRLELDHGRRLRQHGPDDHSRPRPRPGRRCSGTRSARRAIARRRRTSPRP